MMIYVDDVTGEQLSANDVRAKAGAAAPAGASIGLKSEELWDGEYLSEWGVSIVEVIDTAPPEVERPYLVQEGDYDKSVPGVWSQTWDVIEPTLEHARQFSRARLDADFDSALQPVAHDGKLWRPGIASASAIRDVIDMTEFAGGTHVNLADASDDVHEYLLADARHVCLAIGSDYQYGYMERAAKRRAIAEAETAAEALAVTWGE